VRETQRERQLATLNVDGELPDDPGRMTPIRRMEMKHAIIPNALDKNGESISPEPFRPALAIGESPAFSR